MDQTTYYILAWLASSLSALVASANLFIILRDRTSKLHTSLARVIGTSPKTYAMLSRADISGSPSAYRFAVSISNLKSTHVMLTGIQFSRCMLLGRKKDISCRFDGASWPAVIKSGDILNLEISGSSYAKLNKGYFHVVTNRGRYRIQYLSLF